MTRPDSDVDRVSIVVIGRNEGERLRRCLASIRDLAYPRDHIELIYVDTDSTDESREIAASFNARVIRIRPERPTAAAARNAGLLAASHDLIHFFDGDTLVERDWLGKAVVALQDPTLHAVYGRREEMAPEANLYSLWTHHDWYVPPGRVATCGGDVLFRRDDLLAVGGYDASLIAGEERDLCCRLIEKRNIGILRLDDPMTLHDINMTRFGQYWKRCFRSGYAYAQVAARHATLIQWRRTCVRNLGHAAAFLTTVAASAWLWSPVPIAGWGCVIALLIFRNAVRCRAQVGSLASAVLYALHHYISKVPTVVGHLAYYRRHFFGGAPQALVEYRKSG